MPAKITKDFIREIPKTDLHVHIDGSLRLGTLIELAKERKVELPSYTEDGMHETVFKDDFNDLGEYLDGFKYTCAVLQDPEALERVAYELAVDCYAEGVRYIEPRFAPQLHITNEVDLPAVLQSVDSGLARASDEFNQRPEVVSGDEPGYGYGIILCAMRMFAAGFSSYFNNLMRVHAYSPPRATYAMASMELARAAVRIRDEMGLSIIGFDIAGQEDGYPAHDHEEAYDYVHRHFLNKTVHAGEAYGPESIFEAITILHADRIGHGLNLFNAHKITNPAIEDKEEFVRSLAEYIAQRRITVEICLTSNAQTDKALSDLRKHPWKRMVAHRISNTFCTDNRLVSNTTVCRELNKAVKHLGMTPLQLRHCIIDGFKRSFMPLPYRQKRTYVRHIIDYYDALADKHGLPIS